MRSASSAAEAAQISSATSAAQVEVGFDISYFTDDEGSRGWGNGKKGVGGYRFPLGITLRNTGSQVYIRSLVLTKINEMEIKWDYGFHGTYDGMLTESKVNIGFCMSPGEPPLPRLLHRGELANLTAQSPIYYEPGVIAEIFATVYYSYSPDGPSIPYTARFGEPFVMDSRIRGVG